MKKIKLLPLALFIFSALALSYPVTHASAQGVKLGNNHSIKPEVEEVSEANPFALTDQSLPANQPGVMITQPKVEQLSEGNPFGITDQAGKPLKNKIITSTPANKPATTGEFTLKNASKSHLEQLQPEGGNIYLQGFEKITDGQQLKPEVEEVSEANPFALTDQSLPANQPGVMITQPKVEQLSEGNPFGITDQAGKPLKNKIITSTPANKPATTGEFTLNIN